MDRWIGRVAFVTGGSSGIGKEIAKSLVKHGVKVVACSRNVKKFDVLVAELTEAEKKNFFTMECDVKNEEQLLSVFNFINKELGGVDIMINNSGVSHKATDALNGETALWRDVLETNVLSLSICTRESIRSMKARGVDDGHVIHISSMAGHRVAPPVGGGMYAASKYAVRALTESLRRELRELGSKIKVSEISPGFVDTQFLLNHFSGDSEQTAKARGSVEPLTPKDVADAVMFALAAPPHMDINDILIRSTTQKV